MEQDEGFEARRTEAERSVSGITKKLNSGIKKWSDFDIINRSDSNITKKSDSEIATKSDSGITKRSESGVKKWSDLGIANTSDPNLKKISDSDIRRKSESNLKKISDFDITKKSESDLKKISDSDITQKSDSNLKKISDSDITQKSDSNLKKISDSDITQMSEISIKKWPGFGSMKTSNSNVTRRSRVDKLDSDMAKKVDTKAKNNEVWKTEKRKVKLVMTEEDLGMEEDVDERDNISPSNTEGYGKDDRENQGRQTGGLKEIGEVQGNVQQSFTILAQGL